MSFVDSPEEDVAAMELFICERHRGQLHLSTFACGRLYRRAEAQKAKRLDLLGPCRGCCTGEENARGHRIDQMMVSQKDYAGPLF